MRRFREGTNDCYGEQQQTIKMILSLLVRAERSTAHPGCCPGGPSCGAWHHPFQGPFLPCHGQTWLQSCATNAIYHLQKLTAGILLFVKTAG